MGHFEMSFSGRLRNLKVLECNLPKKPSTLKHEISRRFIPLIFTIIF